MVLAKAETVLSQLLGLDRSTAILNSQSVTSAKKLVHRIPNLRQALFQFR